MRIGGFQIIQTIQVIQTPNKGPPTKGVQLIEGMQEAFVVEDCIHVHSHMNVQNILKQFKLQLKIGLIVQKKTYSSHNFCPLVIMDDDKQFTLTLVVGEGVCVFFLPFPASLTTSAGHF